MDGRLRVRVGLTLSYRCARVAAVLACLFAADILLPHAHAALLVPAAPLPFGEEAGKAPESASSHASRPSDPTPPGRGGAPAREGFTPPHSPPAAGHPDSPPLPTRLASRSPTLRC